MIIPSSHKVREGELEGKVILVTGANRGFGLAMTMDLSKAGATVIMLGRDLGSLEYAYDAVIEKGFQEPILYPLDIEGATPENYQSLQDDIFNQFEKLDGLIHNAAILGTMMPVDQYAPPVGNPITIQIRREFWELCKSVHAASVVYLALYVVNPLCFTLIF